MRTGRTGSVKRLAAAARSFRMIAPCQRFGSDGTQDGKFTFDSFQQRGVGFAIWVGQLTERRADRIQHHRFVGIRQIREERLDRGLHAPRSQ